MPLENLEIPEYLRAVARTEANPWTPPKLAGVPIVDPVQQRQDAIFAKRQETNEAKRKAKNALGMQRMAEKHPNEKWNRKLKVWEPK